MKEPLKKMVLALMGPPPFKFHKELYDKLVREREDGETLAAPEKEPDVEFQKLAEGQLGRFDPKTHRITADVFQNYLACVTGDETGPDDLRREFDERLTKTLAHEGGHWHLQVRSGWWPIVEKIAIQFGFLLVLGGSVWLIYTALLGKALGLVPWAYHHYHLPGGIAAGLVATALMFVLYQFMSHGLMAARVLSFAAMYRLCYTERYARRWEKKPEDDRRWEEVIET